MALKDWSQIGIGKWQKIHSSKHNNHPVLAIIVPNAFGKKQTFDVVIMADSLNDRVAYKLKSFKVESQAYKYVGSYMRTH